MNGGSTLLAVFLVSAAWCNDPEDRDVRGAERAFVDEDDTVQRGEAPAVDVEGKIDDSETAEPIEDEGAVVVSARATVGARDLEYLVDPRGWTLYVFTADVRGRASNCFDNCAEAWPPLLTAEEPEATARAVQGNLLGTIERPSGVKQVTYAGWPLYTYEGDRQPGQITGQGMEGRGGVWYVIGPDGEILR